MTRAQRTRRQCIMWFSFMLSGFGWTSFCFGQANEPFSYTAMPTKIIVAFTDVRSDKDWNKIKATVKTTGQPYPCNMVQVEFKEYLKDVVSHEWNMRYGKDETLDFLKAGAVAAKTKAWDIRNQRKYQGLLVGKDSNIPNPPDIQSSTRDQLYIRDGCQGEDTPECMGKTWQRTPIVDQAVEETFDTILKRHNCFYMYGINDYPAYKEKCPGVFETNYNYSVAGCQGGGLWLSSSCIPQTEGRALMDKESLTWVDMLAYYYGSRPAYANRKELAEKLKQTPLSLYERTEDDLTVNRTVETLNTCMMILHELDANEKIALYRCKERDGNIVKLHFPVGKTTAQPCQTGSQACPLGDHYVDVGMKGILLDTKLNNRQETWFRVQWKVKPGNSASDDQPASAYVIEGWSPDTDIKPADAMSLVEVRVIGARVKAPA